ncbi:MAG: methyltransferase domain-containing protein [Caldilineaceae bacterium]|nr:methyltransferase domain-containing protein [Caldilineaceae bacterium]
MDTQQTPTEQYTWQKTNIADEVLSKRTAATVAGFFTPYLQPGMRLLDCGCGPGTITVDLAALVAPGEVIGIEQDATLVAKAEANAAAANVTNVRFETGDVYALPFADNSFDVAWIHNSIDNPETYAHGYDSALTLKMHTSRTVEKQAGWFLPYLKPGMTLLDCGCGSGSITVGLAKVVAPGQVVGVDIAEAEIERARQRATAANVTNVEFQVGNIYQLDFPDNSFDALFSHNVLEHVGEPGRALAEMHRVLKPGGVIGIRDVDAGGLISAPTDARMDRFLAVYEADWAGTGGHPRLGRHLGSLLLDAGFVDVNASASYEVYNDVDRRKFMADIVVSRLNEADFVERVLERQLADTEELEQMKAAYLSWQARPDGFMALAHGEAVGWKA